MTAQPADNPQPCTRCGKPHLAYNGKTGCNGHNRQGDPCRKEPMEGGTVCRAHGGASPHVKAAAERRLIMAEAAEMIGSFGYGQPREISPTEAIKEELHRTASAVQWLSMIVGQLEQDRLAQGVTKIETKTGFQAGRSVTIEGKPSVWYQMWTSERQHYAKVADIAHRMGIDERQTQVIEMAAQLGVVAISRILGQLELTAPQQLLASRVVPDVLRSISATVDLEEQTEEVEGQEA
jgi:hypothetical protein